MGGFDWIIAAIFLVSILVGVMRGFIRESLSIISWIAAIWLATTFCVEAGDFLGQYIDIPNQKFRTWGGFALIFVGTLFIFSIISYVIAKIFVRGAVKGTDRVLGIGFGALRAAAIMVAFIIVVRGLGMNNASWWSNSSFLSYFQPAANYVEAMLPPEWQNDPIDDADSASEEEGSVSEVIQGKVIEGVIENFNQ